MGVISRKEFFERAAQDPALGEKLEALSREFDEKLRALAAQEGFELEEVQPLSDEEAAGTVGGIYGPLIPTGADRWRQRQSEIQLLQKFPYKQ